MKWTIILTAAVSLLITAVLGFVMIPWLRKIKCGQTIKEIGPTWHKKKQGTPTMGGFMFITGTLIALIVGLIVGSKLVPDAAAHLPNYSQSLLRLLFGVIATLLFSAVGFIDDYLKVVRHNNAGLRGWYKIIFQTGIAALYLGALVMFGGQTSVVDFPFIGKADLGIFFYILSMLMIVGVVNAVNLTDGLDGLNASVTAVVSISFIVIALLVGGFSMSIFAAAVAGGCIGFLLWNFYPAKVFMGDTGSMFLGGAVITLAYGLNVPMLIVFAGIIYFCEAGSDVLQVLYFKATHGKRIFKMAPIHHHFEMCGFSEVKIAIMFCTVSLIGGAIAILSLIV